MLKEGYGMIAIISYSFYNQGEQPETGTNGRCSGSAPVQGDLQDCRIDIT